MTPHSFDGRILNESGEPVGSCWLAAPGVVLTACHVVKETLQLDPSEWWLPSENDASLFVTVEPLAQGVGQRCVGRLCGWSLEEDVAVLRLVDSTQWRGHSPRLIARKSVIKGSAVSICGFADWPDPDRSRLRWVSISGTWQGNSEYEDGTDLGLVKSSGVQLGMSGAAVVRDIDGGVVGMITSRYNSADGWGRDTVWVTQHESIAHVAKKAGVRLPPAAKSQGQSEGESKLVRGLPDSEVTRALRASREAEIRGRYGEALRTARLAQATAEALPEAAQDTPILVAVARVQVAASVLRADEDPEESWALVNGAADPRVFENHPSQFFVALLTKAEAALHTNRLAAAKAALGAAQGYIEGPGDDRMILQVRGMTALAEHDLELAIELYSKAADSFVQDQQTEPDPIVRARWQAGAASCMLNKGLAQQRGGGDVAAATESFQRSAAWYHEAGSRHDESVARRHLAHALFNQEFWADGFREIDAAIRVALDIDFWVGAAEATELKARALATRGEPAEARDALEQVLAMLSDHQGSLRERRRALQMLATLESDLGNTSEAKRRLDEATTLAASEHDALAIADIDVQRKTMAGATRRDTSAPDEVVAALAAQVRVEERPGRAAYLSHKLAGAFRSRGDLSQAAEWYERASVRAKAVGDHAVTASSLIGLVELALHRDDSQTARRRLEEARAAAQSVSDPEIQTSLQYFTAILLRSEGRLREARAILIDACDVARARHLNDLITGIQEELTKVENELSLYRPTLSLGQLATELANLESWYPEESQSIRRFWYYWRDAEVLANIRSHAGSKALFVTDRPDELEELAQSFSALFDLDVFAAQQAFAVGQDAAELAPFPRGTPLPFCVNVATTGEYLDAMSDALEGDDRAKFERFRRGE